MPFLVSMGEDHLDAIGLAVTLSFGDRRESLNRAAHLYCN